MSKGVSTIRRSWRCAFAVLCALMLASAFLAPRSFAYAESSSASASASTSVSSADSSSPNGATAPVASDPFADAATVDIDDGLYTIDVKLEGGSGRASVTSPAEFEVFEGRGVVTLVWSSSHYDYVLVGGKKYLPTNTRGNSTFVVPVVAYDEPVALVGDTTAMGDPREVDYTLTVSRASAQPYASPQNESSSAGASGASASGSSTASGGATASASGASASQVQGAAQDTGLTWPWVVFIVCAFLSAVAIGVTIGILRGYRNR